jgi:hypothetical protein
MGNKFTSDRKRKRSPLKALPLHTAGQSIDEEISRIQSVEIGSYVAGIACMTLLSIFEWYRWIRSSPPSPLSITIGSIIVISYCIHKIYRYKKEIKKLRLARDGEKAVGEFLDLFRNEGYRVLHDLVVGDFNIDHILIGKNGIYTIETKTISKFTRGIQKIYYDGNEISVNGVKPDRNPIIQAKAQANWVKEFIQEFYHKDIQIQPVIVFPGWYIEGTTKADVWVLEPKALRGFLSRGRQILDEKDIPMIASNLTRYLRTREEFKRNQR